VIGDSIVIVALALLGLLPRETRTMRRIERGDPTCN
jgi:hypothetical protein